MRARVAGSAAAGGVGPATAVAPSGSTVETAGATRRTTAPPAPRGSVYTRHELARLWYLPLLAGLLPVLVGGFAVSALANRIVFAGWSVGFAALYTVALRLGLDRGWARRARAVALLSILAAAAGVFALLVARHAEILDLGYRAVLPGIYTSSVTRPATWWGLAALLALAAAARFLLGRRRAGGEPEADAPAEPIR